MFCLACGVDLKESRRLLCSSSTKQVLPVLLETVKDAIWKDVRLEKEKADWNFHLHTLLLGDGEIEELGRATKECTRTLVHKCKESSPLLACGTRTAESISQVDDQGERPGRKRQLSPQRVFSSSPKRRRQLMSKATVVPSDSSSPAGSVSYCCCAIVCLNMRNIYTYLHYHKHLI